MNHKLFLLLIPALLLASCAPKPSSSNSDSTVTTSETISTSESIPSPDEIEANKIKEYYKDIDTSLTGVELLSQVRELTISKHTVYTNYGHCRGEDAGGYYHKTDADPEKPRNIIMFYTHASLNVPWDKGRYYNREHVWPQSLSAGNWGTEAGGADLHHIRPVFKEINSARSNDLYGDCNKQGLITHQRHSKTYEAGYSVGDVFEPMDFAKGDVARIILYNFIHYNNQKHLEQNDNLQGHITSTKQAPMSYGNMPITNVIDGNTQEAFDLLIKWNKLDPVDELETNRNKAIAKIQGNRNPFIDHPEFIDAIWG